MIETPFKRSKISLISMFCYQINFQSIQKVYFRKKNLIYDDCVEVGIIEYFFMVLFIN